MITIQEWQFTGFTGRGHHGNRAWPKVTKKARGLQQWT